MWHLEHELEIWFDEVKRAREEKYGTPNEGDESGPMMTNEFSRQRKE